MSIIAICYNHERFIVDCLESIGAQTYGNVELIVVDDHSRDHSPEVIASWIAANGVEATFIAHTENRGVCWSRNEALTVAGGDYLACISTDDAWLPDKITAQVAQMENLPDRVAVVYGDAQLMDESGGTLPGMFIESNAAFEHPPEGRIFEDLLPTNFIPSLSTLVRRPCVEAVGGYDESLVYEDWDMWLRLSRRYEFAFTPDVVARYRIVDDSLIHALHGERRVEFFESSLRLLFKHVGVRPQADDLIRHRVNELAYALDLLDHPGYLALLGRLDGSHGR